MQGVFGYSRGKVRITHASQSCPKGQWPFQQSHRSSLLRLRLQKSAILPDEHPKKYFLKIHIHIVWNRQDCHAIASGEFHSASAIDTVVPGFCMKPVGSGQYPINVETRNSISQDMDFSRRIITRVDPRRMECLDFNIHYDREIRTYSEMEPRWPDAFAHQLKDSVSIRK
ncbi:uncharacterized protein BDR25DRAFT_361233 [Lindgomyces ingoldianus]|uniref:Uncharacterized protein n=1 Tax=Lindgomyces ingoldianus TaxID=673940 RepID=A0ACB6QCQ1_9PLEO|nr:uncharacterized protein BDR25DRAFT_361233 [Lindgomyces ingoldianus]KAF2464686.1 hypothetical protein BDR25DRAFT_361233 [Lindgomyces ingoldianus]